jgi:hypothetical protein
MDSRKPFEPQHKGRNAAPENQQSFFRFIVDIDVKQFKIGIHEGFFVVQQALFDFGEDTAVCHDVLRPHAYTTHENKCLQPEGWVDDMRYDNERQQGIDAKGMYGAKNASFSLVVGFPKEQSMDDPFNRIRCLRFHCGLKRKEIQESNAST